MLAKTRDGICPHQNRLLAALSGAERERIFPHLQLVSMALGKVLSEPGNVQRYGYFPIDCIVSFSYLMRDGASTEIAVAGNEGLVGLALFAGAQKTQSRAVVQSAGNAYRLAGERLTVECHRGGGLQAMLLRYTHAVMTQIAHTAACNRHHTVDQQLCRSLLAYLDRVSSNQLSLTQELISNMLGVRREGVNSAATKLQSLGAIRYSRGQIIIVDRSKLERESCECYTAIKKETERLVSLRRPSRASQHLLPENDMSPAPGRARAAGFEGRRGAKSSKADLVKREEVAR